MTMAQKFMLQQVNGTAHLMGCPDPEEASWDFLEPIQVSLTGRGVQQGRLKVVLTWEFMSDDDFGNLFDEWIDSRNHGFRLESVTVPTFAGHDNYNYETYTGSQVGGFVRMMRPLGTRLVGYVRDVTVEFQDILEND